MLADPLALAADMLEGGPVRDFPTPGDLAAYLDPRTNQTEALGLLDRCLLRLTNGDIDRLIWTMPPQEGKALALDTPIATPDGWTTIGELRVGDQVFDRNGKPCNVTWVSPTWHDRPCYTVRTGDGETITADARHEWVARLDRRRSERLCETTDLARARRKNAQITGPAGLELPTATLPLDPYVLGAWLGDGHTTAAMLTCADPEIVERIRATGVPCRKATAKYAWSLAPEGGGKRGQPSPVRRALTELGVWGDKHIPASYMRGSTEQRLALLQGLVDTDGYVDPRGQVEFCSTSERLAKDVRELVFTLGAKATIHTGRATLGGKDCGAKYRVRFFLKDAAHLPRKAERCTDSGVARVRYAWAEPAPSVPTRCIEVDSPDHTYLAGRTLLPTHNSQRISRTYPLWLLLRNPDLRIAIVSYEAGIARRWGRAIRNDIATHPELGLTVRHDTSAAHEWQLDGHDGGVITTGIEGALTGRPVDVLIIDDPVKGRAEADSEAYREAAWTFWTETASTRLAPGAPVVLLMTRWHEDDLAGRLLASESRDEWTYVNIPALADHDVTKGETDPLGRAYGQWLNSARRRTVAMWERIKRQVGSRAFTALFQGKPAPAEGGIFKRKWWVYYPKPRAVERSDGTWHAIGAAEVIQSWDCSFKDTKASDWVVGQIWARRGSRVWLLDQVRDRMDLPTTVKALQALSAKWPQARLKLVEEKANGAGVIQVLKGEIGGIVAVNPTDSKESRANAVAPFIEGQDVEIPSPSFAPWIAGFVEECASFPNGMNDDQVDGMTQALGRIFLGGTSADRFMRQLLSEQNQGPAQAA